MSVPRVLIRALVSMGITAPEHHAAADLVALRKRRCHVKASIALAGCLAERVEFTWPK